MNKKVGVLALQGGVREHINLLSQIKNVTPLEIKNKQELKQIDGLIIPGGESTTIGKLLKIYNFVKPIQNIFEKKIPIWGTCAGLILVAKHIIEVNSTSTKPGILGLLDITVKRNAFGSQLNSFITRKKIAKIAATPLELVFIRAPIITEFNRNINILAKYKQYVIAAEKDNVFVTAFHPELTEDVRVHQYFVDKI